MEGISQNLDWFEEDSDEALIEGLESEDGVGNENSGRVFIDLTHLDHDILKAIVKCEKIESPVIGVAFHLKFDNSRLAFLKYDPGNFLEKGGDPFYIVSAEQPEIIFGETLRRDDSFPLGEGEIVNFYFQKTDAISIKDDYEFSFFNGVVSSLDETRQDLDKVEFVNFPYREINEESDSFVSETLELSTLPENIQVNSSSPDTIVLPALIGVSVFFLGLSAFFFYKLKQKKASE